MRTLGIELGRQAVRAVMAERRRGSLQILAVGTVPLVDESLETLVDAVREARSLYGRGAAQVVLGLPLELCSVKLVRFPSTTPENLARLARVEAESHLPLPPQEIEFGHTVVDLGGGGREATVAIAACRKDDVSQRLDALGTYEHAVVDVSALALANLFHDQVRHEREPHAVLNLDAGRAELVILDGRGQLAQVRSLPAVGGELPEELRRTLQAYAGAAGQGVRRCLLVGADAGTRQYELSSVPGVELSLADPWHGGSYEAQEAPEAYAVATGLASRAGETPLVVNLAPRAVTEAESQRRQSSTAGLVVAALFVLLVAGAGLFYKSYQDRRHQADLAHREVERLQQELKAEGGEDPALLQRLSDHAEQVRKETDWLWLLKQMSEKLPGQVAIQELTCDRQRPLTIRGEAFTNQAIAQTIECLDGLGLFATVRLDQANAETVEEEVLYRFQLTCLWPEQHGTKPAGAAVATSRSEELGQ